MSALTSFTAHVQDYDHGVGFNGAQVVSCDHATRHRCVTLKRRTLIELAHVPLSHSRLVAIGIVRCDSDILQPLDPRPKLRLFALKLIHTLENARSYAILVTLAAFTLSHQLMTADPTFTWIKNAN